MKFKFTISIIALFILIACGEQRKQDKIKLANEAPITNEPSTKPKVEKIVYDTSVIDYDLINKKINDRNERFKELNDDQVIDSLKAACIHQGLREYNSDGLDFNNSDTLSKYYKINIPLSIYEKIFPNEDIKIYTDNKHRNQVNHKTRKVTIKKGTKVRDERIYRTLVSMIDKGNYFLMIFTRENKYAPAFELITVSKSELKKIDNLELLGGIYDSYDIDYWHTSVDDNHSSFTKTKVINKEYDDIDLDTSIIVFKLSNQGKVLVDRTIK